MPMTASSSGYRPSAIMTSRKLAGMVRTATRTWPGCQRCVGVRDGLEDQVLEGALAGHAQSPRLVTRGHQQRVHRSAAVHPTRVHRFLAHHDLRLAGCQYRARSSYRSAAHRSRPARSGPGCSVCAARTSPHTAAPAKSVTSSPGNPTAPRVDTSSIPESFSESQDCSAASASWVRGVCRGQRIVVGGLRIRTRRATASRRAIREPRVTRRPRRSGPGPEPDTAAINCCRDTGRATIDATDSTGNPSPSASSTDTDDGPDGAMRARTDDAPAACSDTPCHENGTRTPFLPSWSASVGHDHGVQGGVQHRGVHAEAGR